MTVSSPLHNMKLMDDKNFDQSTATEWIKIIESSGAGVREDDIYPLLRSWLLKSSAKEVLDIGCGQGVCAAHLGKPQIRYVGVDPSLDLINRAKEIYSEPTRSFVLGNAYALPFKDELFEAAFSVAVWHLLGDLAKASKELSRVLKSDGDFLIITADPNKYNSWTERYEERNTDGIVFTGTNQSADGGLATDRLYLYSLDQIIGNMKEQGLIVSTRQTVRDFIALSGTKTQ